jgi:twitching motility protein PilJ
MIDDKSKELEAFDTPAEELEESYNEEEFAAFEGLDDEDEFNIEAPAKRGNERLWLYLGLAALLSAVLLRLLLAPVIDIQKQRNDQSAEIQSQVQLTNVSAAEALAASGEYTLLESNLVYLQQNVEQMVLPQNLSSRIANRLFDNISANAELSAAWDDYRDTTNDFLSKKDAVQQVKQSLAQLNTEVSETVGETIAFVDAVAKEGRGKRSGDAKDRYLFLTSEAANINGVLSRLSAGLRNYYLPTEDLQRQSDTQNAQVVRLKDTLTRITGNADAVVGTAAEPLQARFDSIEAKLLEVSDNAGAISASRANLQDLNAQAQQLTDSVVKAGSQSNLVGLINTITNLLPLLLVAFGIFAMWRFFSLQSEDLVQSEGSLSEALADQQESILKLLDEMSALADGDLTVEAEVTDQITGAIADSVNFAVIEMRELVTQINRASLEVANESELAVSNAQAVSLSNKSQADNITSAAQEMQRVTTSMREMSEQARESSDMATESINAATQGAQAVRDTITGMENMRDQIQETSKRIKRLGESSQRIGDIVALIDDIAEQTNILSLNAAIQASMAGEAGRGFAVVSDEVQSLAERSTEATKKIAELVTTIQNDTNDAVASMEKATQQVVSGTRVADTAGSALAEIEKVSQSLSNLIQTIAQRSNQQAEVVTDVAQKVTTVSDSSIETSKKAQDSANSIAKLLELAK